MFSRSCHETLRIKLIMRFDLTLQKVKFDSAHMRFHKYKHFLENFKTSNFTLKFIIYSNFNPKIHHLVQPSSSITDRSNQQLLLVTGESDGLFHQFPVPPVQFLKTLLKLKKPMKLTETNIYVKFQGAKSSITHFQNIVIQIKHLQLQLILPNLKCNFKTIKF